MSDQERRRPRSGHRGRSRNIAGTRFEQQYAPAGYGQKSPEPLREDFNDLDLVSAALDLAEGGLYVFPAKDKRPYDPETQGAIRFTERATRDQKQIEEWFDGAPDDVQVAVACGPTGLVVVDEDHLGVLPDGWLEPTLVSVTREGRRQHWYRAPSDRRIGNSTGDLPKGFGDIRGCGGYVVAPPSVHHVTGERYRFEDPTAPIARLPSEIADRLPDAGPTSGAHGTAVDLEEWLDEHDDKSLPGWRERIIDRTRAKYEVGGISRHEAFLQATVQSVIEVRAGGLNGSEMYHALTNLWDDANAWGDHANEPGELHDMWTGALTKVLSGDYDEDVEVKAAEVARWRRRSARGTTAGQSLRSRSRGDYAAVQRTDGIADQFGSRLLTTEQLADLPAPRPLIEGYLYETTLAVLFGPSEAGKTFLALDWSMHIAHGRRWNGRDVVQGRVLYVVAEGVAGIYRRAEAWTGYHGIPPEQGEVVLWYPEAVDMLDAATVDAVAEVAQQLGAVLVVIDTLARNIAGADENSAKDMGLLVAACDRIRTTADAAVLLVHHVGHENKNRARGHSSLRAAMDTEINLTADQVVKVAKSKDWEKPADLRLGFRRSEGSVVLVPQDRAETAGEMSGKRADLRSILESVDDGTGVSNAQWLRLATAGELFDSMSESSYYHAKKSLIDSGAVVVEGKGRAARYSLADPEQRMEFGPQSRRTSSNSSRASSRRRR